MHKRIVQWREWLVRQWQTRKVALLWGLAAAFVVVGLSTYFVGSFLGNRVISRTGLIDVATIDLADEKFAAPLSGLLVDRLDAARPVTGIIIENSTSARPQSGLSSAEVVFEAISEGGITRFAVFYQARQATKIGPVRSVRSHYNDWVMSFDATIAHVGGSPAGLSEIRRFGIKDLDQFANSGAYYRDPARFAPHNMYTSSSRLDSLQRQKGFNRSQFTPWEYQDPSPAEKITAQRVQATVSSGAFNVRYDYSPKNNKYLRSIGGEKHIDANNSRQIAVDNAIIMEVPYTIGGIYYNYRLTGSGTAHIFKNGEYIKATWSRSSRQSSFKFVIDGENVVLNRGQTWVTAIAPGNRVNITAAPETAD